jgi:hypothetical protein
MTHIDPRLVQIALDHIEGTPFERFFHEFGAGIFGEAFIPVGGHHDGGVDAFDSEPTLQGTSSGTYYQASIQKDVRGKIRGTIKRLNTSGRNPEALWYISALEVPDADLLEVTLSQELGLTVRIRDRRWIASNINRSHQTQAAFKNNLEPALVFLRAFGIGAPNLDSKLGEANRTACIFMAQEVERRRGATKLLDAMTDSLVLWSLEDTDPDQGRLMNKDDMLAKIAADVPFATKIVKGSIDSRLEALSTNTASLGRQIRVYKKEKKYCLPFETRKAVQRENIDDELLRSTVLDVFRQRAAEPMR